MTKQTERTHAPRDNDLDIAIIGMSGRFPGADDVAEFWRNLAAGIDSVEDLGSPPSRGLGEWIPARATLARARAFDALFFGYAPGEAALMDPQQRHFLTVSWEALEDAGYDPKRLPELVAVFGGASSNGYLYRNILSGRMSSDNMVQLLQSNDADFMTARVSHVLDLRGPSISIQTACSSSLVAVHMACQSLRNHECDLAIAGGASILTDRADGYRATTEGIDSLDGRCRSYGAGASGAVFGDGVGAVILKRLSEANRDGDAVRAVILGSAVNNDGRGKLAFSAPSARSQAELIARALGFADVAPASVSYIEGHGTGTPLGDAIEVAGLRMAFGPHRDKPLRLGSVKSNIGHAYAAAGVAGLIKAALSLEQKTLPQSLHCDVPNHDAEFDDGIIALCTGTEPWDGPAPRRAGVTSLGLGGTNAHIVLEEAPPVSRSPARIEPELILLSARTPRDLEAAAQKLAQRLLDEPQLELRDLGRTLRQGRTEWGCRWSAVVESAGAAVDLLRATGCSGTQAPDREPDVVFMFTGTTDLPRSQVVQAYRRFKPFSAAVDECLAAFQAVAPDLDIRSCLLDPANPRGDPLHDAILGQPALFVLQYALTMQLRSFGVRPKALVGHSLGEYAAAVAAGCLTLDDAASLVAARGRVVAKHGRGAMAAVWLGRDALLEILPASLSIAASNAPDLHVVSGDAGDVSAFCQALAERGNRFRELPMDYAFHSKVLDPGLSDFRRSAKGVVLSPPVIPWASSATGEWMDGGITNAAEFWTHHLRYEVRFASAVDSILERHSSAVFIEVGPGETLTHLIELQAQAQAADARAFASFSGNIGAPCSILQALGNLWREGVTLELESLNADGARRVPLPTYPFGWRNHWIEPSQPGSLSLDVQALEADQEVAARTESFLSFTDAQSVVRTTWESVLGISDLQSNADFFELGGHSLLGLEIIRRIAHQTGRRVPLRALREAPTIDGMAGALLATIEQGAVGPRALTPQSIQALDLNAEEPFPLTDIQFAYWVGRNGDYQLGGVGSHLYLEIEVDDLDVGRFQRSLAQVVQRHGMLRAVITDDGGQVILESVEVPPIVERDLAGLSEAERAAAVAQAREKLSHRVVDLRQWPPFEMQVLRMDERASRLLISLDYVFTDAVSIGIVAQEIGTLYGGQELPDPPTLTFPAYLRAVSRGDTPEGDASRAYWRERVAELPPPPELPTRVERAAPRFARSEGRLSAKDWDVFRERAASHGLTPSAAVCAAYAEVVAAWSTTEEFTLNLPVFNREPIHPDVSKVVGDFTSTLLIGLRRTSASFAERASEVQQELWNALENRALSGVELLRDVALGAKRFGSAAMPVVFTSLLNQPVSWSGLYTLSGLGRPVRAGLQTPQLLIDNQVFEDDGMLVFSWDYNESNLRPGVPEAMFTAFASLLDQLTADAGVWDRPVGCLADREAELPTSAIVSRQPTTLHAPFEVQAKRYPDRVAVASNELSLTYKSLYDIASGVARQLRAHGTKRGDRIAVIMEPGWEQVASVVGTHLAAAAYVPIAADLPPARIQRLLDAAECRIALTQRQYVDKVSALKIPHVEVGRHLSFAPGPEGLPADPGDLAYVIFTSGSTGEPKGVRIRHAAAWNTIEDVIRRFGLSASDSVLAVSSLSFDLSVFDIFGLLAVGGKVVLPGSTVSDPRVWQQAILNHNVTVWNSVPALFSMYLGALSPGDPAPRLVMLSGDWLPIDLAARLRTRDPGTRLVSLGGATEASIWSNFHEVDEVSPDWSSVPYGRPLTNQSIYVLNPRLRPCPAWTPGEIFIGGQGVADGYVGDREAERFFRHPTTGERLYRTGDLGRTHPDGVVEILGRVDRQLKIGGFRVEPGEVETSLLSVPWVAQAKVVALREVGAPVGLAAYLVETGSPDVPEEAVLAYWQAHFDRHFRSGRTDERREAFGADCGSGSILSRINVLVRDWAPSSLLDLGCGDASALDSEFIDGLLDYVGVDLSPEAVAAAERRWCRDPSFRRHLRFIAGSALECVPSRAFDLILLRDVARYLPSVDHLSKLLKTLSGRLTKHGRILLTDVAEIGGGGWASRSAEQPHVEIACAEASTAISMVGVHLAIDPAWFVKRAEDFGLRVEIAPGDHDLYHVLLSTGVEAAAVRQTSREGSEQARAVALKSPQYPAGRVKGRGRWRAETLSGTSAAADVGGAAPNASQSVIDAEATAGSPFVPLRSVSPSRFVHPATTPSLGIGRRQRLSELQKKLRGELPPYLVPDQVILLEAMPLNGNGKVDESALPPPETFRFLREPMVGASSEVEAGIIRAFEEVLELTSIGLDDDFFQLGGNSLRALALMARLRDKFLIEVSTSDLRELSTPGDVAELVEQRLSVRAVERETIAEILSRFERVNDEPQSTEPIEEA